MAALLILVPLLAVAARSTCRRAGSATAGPAARRRLSAWPQGAAALLAGPALWDAPLRFAGVRLLRLLVDLPGGRPGAGDVPVHRHRRALQRAGGRRYTHRGRARRRFRFANLLLLAIAGHERHRAAARPLLASTSSWRSPRSPRSSSSRWSAGRAALRGRLQVPGALGRGHDSMLLAGLALLFIVAGSTSLRRPWPRRWPTATTSRLARVAIGALRGRPVDQGRPGALPRLAAGRLLRRAPRRSRCCWPGSSPRPPASTPSSGWWTSVFGYASADPERCCWSVGACSRSAAGPSRRSGSATSSGCWPTPASARSATSSSAWAPARRSAWPARSSTSSTTRSSRPCSSSTPPRSSSESGTPTWTAWAASPADAGHRDHLGHRHALHRRHPAALRLLEQAAHHRRASGRPATRATRRSAVLASVLTLAYFLSMQRRVFFGKLAESCAEPEGGERLGAGCPRSCWRPSPSALGPRPSPWLFETFLLPVGSIL